MEKGILIKIFSIIILLLTSGLVIGFLIGGKIIHDQWNSFYEEKNKEIERYCVCNYLETPREYVLEFPINLPTEPLKELA